MKTLTLIRHAKSSWEHLGLPDIDRPLNPRGQRDAPRMGQRLKQAGVSFEAIIASPATRALETARMIAAQTGFPEEAIVIDRDIYAAPVGRLLTLAQRLDDALERIALVGHNPGFGQLASRLSPAFRYHLPTCGVVRLETDADSWRQVQPGSMRLIDFDYPKRAD